MQIESDFHEAMRAEYAVCFGAVTLVSDGPGWTGRSGDVDKPGYVADGFAARSSAAVKLELSRRHLQRVLAAWDLEIASRIEAYVEAVERLLEESGS